MEGHTKGNGELPSAFQPGQKIGLQGLINALQSANTGKLVSVSFTKDKVKYNIQVPLVSDGEVLGYFRLANIDSELVHAPFENGFHYNDKVAIEARRQDQDSPEPFFDANFHGYNDIPRSLMTSHYGAQTSDEVLIDLDGNRKYFSIGWYDFDELKWISQEGEVEKTMVWTNLPLAKYDKK